MNVLILHGPNLNLLGEREPSIYGKMTLPQLNARMRSEARRLKMTVRIFQRNGEGQLIDLLHQYRKWADGVVFNPGAYTHYSYALRDAVAAIEIPTVEVHLSDIRSREKWRRVSVIEPACVAQIAGKGAGSYIDALRLLKGAGGGSRTHMVRSTERF